MLINEFDMRGLSKSHLFIKNFVNFIHFRGEDF